MTTTIRTPIVEEVEPEMLCSVDGRWQLCLSSWLTWCHLLKELKQRRTFRTFPKTALFKSFSPRVSRCLFFPQTKWAMLVLCSDISLFECPKACGRVLHAPCPGAIIIFFQSPAIWVHLLLLDSVAFLRKICRGRAIWIAGTLACFTKERKEGEEREPWQTSAVRATP